MKTMIEIETRPAPVETVTPIKPSEALRLGRLLYPVEIQSEVFGDNPGEACAIGAMLAGYGYGPDENEYGTGYYAKIQTFVSPALVSQIWKHNDGIHGLEDGHDVIGDNWTTEQIASWLEEQGL
jgi:hypothetical protein